MNNVYLVGFMGTGKTSAGKEAARLTGRSFMDLDVLIEKKEKRAISDIFAKEGERYFRALEKETLKRVSQGKRLIVACGGGIVIDKENIKIMNETGIIICLTAQPQVILKRTLVYTHRPLLNVKDPGKQIELLLKSRAPYYAKAQATLDTSKLSVKQVARNIIKAASYKPPAKSQRRKEKM